MLGMGPHMRTKRAQRGAQIQNVLLKVIANFHKSHTRTQKYIIMKKEIIQNFSNKIQCIQNVFINKKYNNLWQNFNCERCLYSTNFIVEYKESQKYRVPKMENRQAYLCKLGYFNSGSSFQNSVIEEEVLCSFSFISNNSNSPAYFSLSIISEKNTVTKKCLPKICKICKSSLP